MSGESDNDRSDMETQNPTHLTIVDVAEIDLAEVAEAPRDESPVTVQLFEATQIELANVRDNLHRLRDVKRLVSNQIRRLVEEETTLNQVLGVFRRRADALTGIDTTTNSEEETDDA